ncbi:MAG: PAS domain S-box protein, partial [Terriglobales bacterium]
MVGKPVIEFIHPADHGAYQLRQQQRRQGLDGRHETRMLHRDGHAVWVRNVANPIMEADGIYAGSMGMLTDISEMRVAEQALRDSEQQYRHLFEHNAQPMWIYDPTTLGFLAVNQAAIALYGFSREEFSGMTLKDVRPQEELPQLLESHAGLATDPAHRHGIFRHRTRDGRLLDVEIQTHALDFNGRAARHVMIQDITERTRLERQLRQAHKMEAVGRLAGGIAHDFNNLLTVISGYIELLLRRQLGSSVEQEWMRGVQSAAQRAAALTRQLLAFGRQQV